MIQSYDFTIAYKPGNTMEQADTLSRLDQRTSESNVFIKDNGNIHKIPKESERRNIILDAKEKTNHACEIKIRKYIENKSFFWKNMNKDIRKEIVNCQKCIKFKRKGSGGNIFVETENTGDIFSLDFMKHGKEIALIGIDYFSRLAYGKVNKERTPENVIKTLNE